MLPLNNIMKKKIAAQTFGCKINQYETACMLDNFFEAGYEQVDFNEKADVYLINSCTVTNRTDYKSRNALRKALAQKEKSPEIKIVITGCYAQINRDEIAKIGDIDLIIDNNHKNQILSILNGKEYNFSDIFEYSDFEELSTETMLDHSRAFLKVQDGCDFFCAYCTVPYGRGKPRSRAIDKVIDQVKKLVNHGYSEFVIGGINLGLYGIDFDDKEKCNLQYLLKKIEEVDGVEIIRLSSIEPQLFTPGLMSFLKNSKKIAPHFHIPLQSGSNELLRTMGRHYNTSEFKKTIEELRNIFPTAAFGFDLIAGLPGETDHLFQETFDFLSNINFTYLHVFPYSRRPGTRAYDMKNQIKGNITKERVKRLTELSDRKKEQYIEFILNNKIKLKGIIETRAEMHWTSLTDHYVRIYCTSNEVDTKDVVCFIPERKYLNGLEVELID